MSEPVINRTGGGLIPTPVLFGHGDPIYGSRYLVSELSSASWLNDSAPGADQEQDGACALFTIASWIEVMERTIIRSKNVLNAYRKFCSRTGRNYDQGMTFPEALEEAKLNKWLPKNRVFVPAYPLVLTMHDQPILVGIQVTPGWQNVHESGCLDHAASRRSLGAHGVLMVAHGPQNHDSKIFNIFKNWWGENWGNRGLGMMSDDMYRDTVIEQWMIVKDRT